MNEAQERGNSTGLQIHVPFSHGNRWYECSITRKEVTTGDEPRFIVLARDISKRKRTEASLSESRDLLQSVVEHMPGRVFWKDRDSRYLGGNILFAQDAGFAAADELIGKTDFDMVWKDDQAELYRADDKTVMESGIARLNFEEPQIRPEGNTNWLRTSKVPLRDENNQVIGVLGCLLYTSRCV